MRRGAIAFLMGYQKVISPWLPPACRFHPTCSQYAIEAIRQYGCRKGFRQAMGRFLRCHPFHHGGHDPVKK